MFVLTVIVTLVVAAGLTGSAYIKLTRREPYVDFYRKIDVPDSWLNGLAILLIVAAAGLVLGLFWAPVGVTAGIGLAGYFLGALGFHIRAGDFRNISVPAVMLILSIVVTVLRVTTS